MSTRAKVNANSLFNLKLEDIRSIDFGRNFVAYDLANGRFKVTFTSQNDMEVAVEEWLSQARERGEFFRLDAMRRVLRACLKRQSKSPSRDATKEGQPLE